jgi:hypothetical protein
MLEALIPILEIQSLDMKMIQLIGLKRARQDELKNIQGIEADLKKQLIMQDSAVTDTKMLIRMMEGDLAEVQSKLKKLEVQQNAVKKLEEFNALTQETSAADRDRVQKEAKLSDLMDKLAMQEDTMKNLQETLSSTQESSKALIAEIVESIKRINEEGEVLKREREALITKADPEVFQIYQRLLKNKRDQVVVPIENRACSGCHIQLTAQDENLVRKGERLVFCEHCSRIHYWQESEKLEGTTEAPVRQRRRRTAKV